jgi:predicted DNA-binding protein YlxM (UPF0122 family)
MVVKSRRMQLIEHRYRRPIETVLMDLYWREHRSLREIAHELGVNKSTVLRWLALCDIARRPVGEWAPRVSSGTK